MVRPGWYRASGFLRRVSLPPGSGREERGKEDAAPEVEKKGQGAQRKKVKGSLRGAFFFFRPLFPLAFLYSLSFFMAAYYGIVHEE